MNFTISDARRNRISESTRRGYRSGINQVKRWLLLTGQGHFIIESTDSIEETTIDTGQFDYSHYLGFLEWTIQNKNVTIGTLMSYRSAVQNLYKEQGKAIPIEFGDDLKEIYQGIRKTFAQEHQAGDKVATGKRPMSFSTFQSLCKQSLGLSDGGFTHLFLILTWNLMCRSKSTETVRIDHLSCEEDAVAITFYKTKTKQQGTTNKDPKHCYSNPHNPDICLFVALGLYFACNSQLEPGRLFPGSNQRCSYIGSIWKNLGENDESFLLKDRLLQWYQ
ncbi:hypothetical protein AC1031_022042 [Aphanomyces cochlioides]|nr:hypothetical protein AC1031_022042 [Aphanomyces cochlioides]